MHSSVIRAEPKDREHRQRRDQDMSRRLHRTVSSPDNAHSVVSKNEDSEKPYQRHGL